jgi:4-diphosphocytidyl-2-C-methyl-D-erythritol kinase
VASGIGGGSADAAATLHLLNRFWEIGMDDPTLAQIGQTLGADVPVCLFGKTARMQGIGEQIALGPLLPEIGIVLVNPGVGVSTPAVFSARQGAYSTPADLPASFADSAALVRFLSRCHNDLLPPARGLCPEIDTVLTEIAAQEQCLFASLSGSGATCLGLYSDLGTARSVASALSMKNPGWWIEAGNFLAATPPPAVVD